MATAQMDTVIRHLRRAVLRQDAAGWTDGQLLASFIDQKDEAAFEALVRRHGPMVFGVCRRVVRNHHDAEDAFQATFLVLARKASSVRPRERLANWLHGVALRTAMKAKAMTAKRRGREKQVTEMPEPEAAQQDQWRDLQPLLDQELNGLPENYRLPILLCDLEGKTIKEATRQLGWPQGTLAGRLARGRKLLAKRLANRGRRAVGRVAGGGRFAECGVGRRADLADEFHGQGRNPDCGGAGGGRRGGPGQGRRPHGRSAENHVPDQTQEPDAGHAGDAGDHGRRRCRADRPWTGDGPAEGGQQGRGRRSQQGGRQGFRPVPARKADADKTDLDRLQGVWSVVSIEQGGKPAGLEKAVFMVDGKKRAGRPASSK